MDDISEAKARAKEKRKLTRGSSRERFEDGEASGGGPSSKSAERRYSEFNITSLKLQQQQKRRVSELPNLNLSSPLSTATTNKKPGIDD